MTRNLIFVPEGTFSRSNAMTCNDYFFLFVLGLNLNQYPKARQFLFFAMISNWKLAGSSNRKFFFSPSLLQ